MKEGKTKFVYIYLIRYTYIYTKYQDLKQRKRKTTISTLGHEPTDKCAVSRQNQHNGFAEKLLKHMIKEKMVYFSI
jgi:hypothetical protein